MKTYGKLASVAALGLLMVGCVSQMDYDRVRAALMKEKEQNTELQYRLEAAQSEMKALREARGAAGSADLEAKLAAALADKDSMSQKLAELEKRLRDLGVSNISPLPGPIDEALRSLAASNPDILTYDSKKGMVKFSSDLTFALGSVEVTSAAQNVLAKVAGVLNMAEAQRYEAMIVGHTDNVRIGRADTKAKHPTNWHLSVHRSISVKDVLNRGGVGEKRMCVAGYGEFRPLVPNGAKGAQTNRRVEIYLVPSTAGSIDAGAAVEAAPEAAAPAPAPRTAPAVEAPELMK